MLNGFHRIIGIMLGNEDNTMLDNPSPANATPIPTETATALLELIQAINVTMPMKR